MIAARDHHLFFNFVLGFQWVRGFLECRFQKNQHTFIGNLASLGLFALCTNSSRRSYATVFSPRFQDENTYAVSLYPPPIFRKKWTLSPGISCISILQSDQSMDAISYAEDFLADDQAPCRKATPYVFFCRWTFCPPILCRNLAGFYARRYSLTIQS